MARPLSWLNPGLCVGAAIPPLMLWWRAALGQLGANPVERALNNLGYLTLVLLLLTLACTPLQRLFLWSWPARVRRTLGVLSFVYASLHLLVYVAIDHTFDFGEILEEVVKRPFIAVGAATWLALVPLTITSTNASVRRLGFNRWKRLHRMSYLCAALGVLHFYMRVKKDVSQPVLMGAILAALLLVRLLPQRKPARAPGAS